MASQVPRRPPWRVNASSAYWEHDGWNRHRGGRCTLTSRHARTGSMSRRASNVGLGAASADWGAVTGATPGSVRRARTLPNTVRRSRGSAPSAPHRRDTRRPGRGRRHGRPRRLEGVGGCDCGRLQNPPVARSRTRHAPDRWIHCWRSAETPGRPGGGGPERGPRRSHGRGRARSGREPLPAAGTACPKHGSAAARPHSSAETMGFRALAGIGLVGTFQGDWPPRGHRADSEQGSAAGGGATECTGERAGMRNANAVDNPQVPLVGFPSRCYVSAPRGATASTRELPR
jgi:hypothetical protein